MNPRDDPIYSVNGKSGYYKLSISHQVRVLIYESQIIVSDGLFERDALDIWTI